MARCDYCGTTILFGGVRDGEWRFCNDKCHQEGFLLTVADQVPSDILTEHVTQAHQGTCPKCGGPGPVDVHTSYLVWSILVLTSWQSRPRICCQGCGTKAKVGGAFLSGILGWWGFPWGLIITPIQVGRNVVGLFSTPDPATPSDELEKIVKINLASQMVEASRQEPASELPSA